MRAGVDKIVSPITKMSHHTQTGPTAGVTATSCTGKMKKIDKVSQWIDLLNATGQKAKHTPIDHNLKTRPEAAKIALTEDQEKCPKGAQQEVITTLEMNCNSHKLQFTGIAKTGQKVISEGMLNLNPLGDQAKESLGLLE